MTTAVESHPEHPGRFTGAFVGLAALDPVTDTLPADLASFDHA